MSRPRLLDAFCGGGGAAVGYHRAGFDVVGVDSEPQPDYPFEVHRGDALKLILERHGEFDAFHASPPCQPHTSLRHSWNAGAHDDYVAAVRELLVLIGKPWVIENVPGAPLRNPLTLCGSEFGLGADCHDGFWRQLRRHRLFESSAALMSAGGCRHRGQPIGVYGTGGGGQMTRGYKATRPEARDAMGVDWMGHRVLVQAIPPVYAEHVGSQIIEQIGRAAA